MKKRRPPTRHEQPDPWADVRWTRMADGAFVYIADDVDKARIAYAAILRERDAQIALRERDAQIAQLRAERDAAQRQMEQLMAVIKRKASRQASAADAARRQSDPGAPERARTHDYCSAILELLLDGD